MKFKVTNWAEYEAGLRRRGSLTLWITPEALASWAAPRRKTRDGQPLYSDLAIETTLMLGMIFVLRLRQSEGLVSSVLDMMALDLPLPDHTTLSRRARTWKPSSKSNDRQSVADGPAHVLIDSTGLKIYGAGQWFEEKHGAKSWRGWRKLYLAVDADSGEIIGHSLTDQEVGDVSQLEPLLDQIDNDIGQLTADGAYDGTPTGARHFHKNAYATHIGGRNFTVFRTTPSKSRLNFLSLLRGNYQDYVLNDVAFGYLHERRIDPVLLARLKGREPHRFVNQVPFLEHLAANGIDIFDKELIRPLAEAGIWGAIRHHGLIGNTVIVSDDAGQFRVGNHALCWVHAERLLQKLMPATPRQVRQVETVRDLIWRFYKALKAWRQRPDARLAVSLEVRFDRIVAIRTGYCDIDKLLLRLSRRKPELLRVLQRPEIPLHTNASENDLRSFAIKRKISGGTMSRDGRIARDTLLGLMKTCQKMDLSFWHYLGDRLGIGSPDVIPPLATMIAART